LQLKNPHCTFNFSGLFLLQLFFDDANSPSLLSLPYIGWIEHDDSIYRATRNFILGDGNPFFFRGSAGEGIGSPHVPWRFVWPMSIIMQALTSSSDDEISQCLATLRDTTAGNAGLSVLIAAAFTQDIIFLQAQISCMRASTLTTQAILPGLGLLGPTHYSETLY
jgi:meiotically up-regulated gene 157 (Mug157) protein